MTSYFSLGNYLLMALAIILQYPIGRKIVKDGIFSACLVGIGLSGLGAAILANVSAGMISYFLYAMIMANAAVVAFDFIKKRRSLDTLKQVIADRNFIVGYGIVAAIGIYIFIANNPAKVFLDKQGANTFLNFNSHYSYFASISIEMLNAEYFSRLKVMNVYPYEWTQYHFFNGGAFSAIQIFIGHPNLFTYFMTQAIILVLIGMAAAEQVMLSQANRWTAVGLFIVWLLIGFTIFSGTLMWNLATTGIFSVFGVVCFILALYRRHYEEALLYLLICGVSAFRLFPVVALTISLFAMWLLLQKFSWQKPSTFFSTARQWIKNSFLRFNFYQYGLMILALGYALFTLETGEPSEEAKSELGIGGDPFSANGWQGGLILFRIIGFIYSFFFQTREAFKDYDAYGPFFERINSNILFRYLFVVVIISIIVFVVRNLKQLALRKKDAGKYLLVIFILFVVFRLVLAKSLAVTSTDDIIFYHLIVIPYCFGLFMLAGIALQQKREAIILVLILFLVTYVSQYTTLPASVKFPISWVFFDLLIWSMLLAYFLETMDDSWWHVKLAGFVVCTMLIIPMGLSGAARLPESYHSEHFDITPLTSKTFRRSDFVDEKTNMMTYDGQNEVANDIYSSVLGARMNFHDNYGTADKVLNYRFITR